MPLNMNTVGTGNGIGGNGSDGKMYIENSVLNKTEKISKFYDMNIQSISPAIKYTEYERADIIYEKFFELNGVIYALVFESGGSYSVKNARIRKYTLTFVEESAALTYTDVVSLPDNIAKSLATSAADNEVIIYSFGNYAYLFNGEDVNSTDSWICRFDGTTITEVSTWVKTFNLLFNETPIYGYYDTAYNNKTGDTAHSSLYVSPLFTKGNVSKVLINYSTRWGSTYDEGYTYVGIFEFTDDGVKCLVKRKFKYDKDYNTNYLFNNFSCIKDLDSEVIQFTSNGATPLKRVNKLTWDYDASSGYHTLRNTVTDTNITFSDGGEYVWNPTVDVLPVSTPEFDYRFYIVYGEDASYDTKPMYRGYWFSLVPSSGVWDVRHTEISPYTGTTYNSVVLPKDYDYGFGYYSTFIHINDDNPYIIYGRFKYTENSSYRYKLSTKLIIHKLQCDISYKSDHSRFIYTAYLHKGDIVHCDDNIYTYEKSGNTTNVNTTKLIIPADGTYKITTGMYDAKYEPSIVVTDKNGNITHFKYELTTDGKLLCYPIKGMIINGTKITKSKRQIINSDMTNRFIVSMK